MGKIGQQDFRNLARAAADLLDPRPYLDAVAGR